MDVRAVVIGLLSAILAAPYDAIATGGEIIDSVAKYNTNM